MMFTDISKRTIGRLRQTLQLYNTTIILLYRPHFLTVCDPWSNDFKGNCTAVKNYCNTEPTVQEAPKKVGDDGCTETYYRYTGDMMEDNVICGSLLKNPGNETLQKV